MSSDPVESLERPGVPPDRWPLDPGVVFLNHGSFGSCPCAVLEFQRGIRDRMERQPVDFMVRDLEPLVDAARAALAGFVGADPDDLVFVANATGGVNTVLRSLTFAPGDELLVTNHEYQACRNALEFVAARSGARVVVADVPFPLKHPMEVVDSIARCVSPRTRLALVDHVTSQTGLVLPIEAIVATLRAAGVDVLVDGAHAPGMVPIDLGTLGATYYTGNCHKWLCAPKSAGFLHVARHRQDAIRPLAISHGASSLRTDRSRFLIEFGWTGTWDPTACLSVPEAIRCLASLFPGGWPGIMARNRALALRARSHLADALGIPLPCPERMIGTMASLPLPDASTFEPPRSPLCKAPLHDRLRTDFGIEVPIILWPAPPRRLVRISCQLYNTLPEYRKLADALGTLLGSRGA